MNMWNYQKMQLNANLNVVVKYLLLLSLSGLGHELQGVTEDSEPAQNPIKSPMFKTSTWIPFSQAHRLGTHGQVDSCIFHRKPSVHLQTLSPGGVNVMIGEVQKFTFKISLSGIMYFGNHSRSEEWIRG